MRLNLIAPELQELVSWSVKLLGEAIQDEYGVDTYKKIENIRKKMKTLRGQGSDKVYNSLNGLQKNFKNLPDKDLHQLCNSYSLMLELINRCENAYRSFRLEGKQTNVPKKLPHAIIFVLTAHPTEARSPELLGLFERIQEILLDALRNKDQRRTDELYHLLFLSLKVSLARKFSPSVADEANNIYSYILKTDILDTLVKYSRQGVNVSFRSWVGGDKDGHPGVDEKTLVQSLNLSRGRIISYIDLKLCSMKEMLKFLDENKVRSIYLKIGQIQAQLNKMKKLGHNDGVLVKNVKKDFKVLIGIYEKTMKIKSPELEDIERILWIFPALVVALEIREDSAVVAEALIAKKKYAIVKMLEKLKLVSKGFPSKWYVRGFVLSMCESHTDIENGIKLTKKYLGGYYIPVVPLFENEKALTSAVKILKQTMANQGIIQNTHIGKWGARYEVMVGYSDSSKENGVLPSRIMISSALKSIETCLKKHGLTPVFFHGSGGSIERGGGSLQEQTGWWPKSAIEIFKATIQGEMVARTFGSHSIFSSQIQTIINQLGTYKSKPGSSSKILKEFTAQVRKSYSSKIQEDDFLKVIEQATPYSFLHHLKIGSRPSKRAGGSIKNNLRAIPWILCWTQTRILFPTWWGVGSAWDSLNEVKKKEMLVAFKDNPVLRSYVKALGFTMAKIELGVWRLYIENSDVPVEIKKSTYKNFENELSLTKKFFKEITGGKNFLWFRPWLQESIDLRSAMIHPLNLCQLESLRRGDIDLLRSSVTGIACGMLTTG